MTTWCDGGALTLSFGAITATFQNDIKKLVAYSTISQIGYLVCGCGFCCYEEVLLYLIIHALNKAFLFVLVGYTVHFFSGNTDLRQMGGAYLYSFDISALLFGCCFNLAGLPYSAGFLGKEFLLLQVLRDDFLSLFIRGCWLVSFFFTPIYMFMLVYLAMFGVKKGSIVAYDSAWNFSFLHFTNSLAKINTNYSQLLGYRFQQTTVTSRSTSYFLLSFWLFFFFYGETLLLILFNYSSPIDTITSSSFFLLKQHVIFYLTTTPSKLVTFVNFYIFVLTTSSFVYLTNLNYSYNYNYLRTSNINSLTMLFIAFVCLIY